MRSYEDRDDEIKQESVHRSLRLDDTNGPNVRNLERRLRYDNPKDQQTYRDMEDGSHFIVANGDNTGMYAEMFNKSYGFRFSSAKIKVFFMVAY